MSMFSRTGTAGSLLDAIKEQAQGAFGGHAGAAGDGILGGALPGLLGAGALGGIAGALFSGKSMKKVAANALTVGGGVAVGALAWNLYKKWSGGREGAPGTGSPQGATAFPLPANAGAGSLAAGQSGPGEDGMLFLEAVVFAARADGHVDETERARITELVERMYPGQGAVALLDRFMNTPIDPDALARRVRTREEAQAVYKLSCLMLDVDHFMERAYLDALARSLGLDRVTSEALERQAEAAARGETEGAGTPA